VRNPLKAMKFPSGSPSSSSITMQGIPSCSMTSKTVTTLGWFTRLAARTSLVKKLLRFFRRGQRAQNHLQGDSLARAFVCPGPHRRHSALANQALNPVLPIHELACPQDGIDCVVRLGFGFPHSAPLIVTGETERAARPPPG